MRRRDRRVGHPAAPHRPRPRRLDPGRDRGGALLPPARQQLVDPRAVHADAQVEAVEQRAGQPPQVAGPRPLVAAARPGWPTTARARVRGRDEQEAGRQRGTDSSPGDAHDTVLQRLAQPVEHVPRELSELVQEEDASVAAAGFTRPEGGRAAADQADQRAGVVRGTERGAAHQAARRQLQARCGMDHRGLQRDLWRERRQQPGQALGQHRLAGPRRTDEQEVVPTGGGDLQCPPGRRLAADVGQVERRRRILHRS